MDPYQPPNQNPMPGQPAVVYLQRPESGTATALAVVSMVFGSVGLLGSFIPCLGALAIYVGVPAALCGAGALILAKKKRASIGFPVAAMIISLLGVAISSVQLVALNRAAKAARESNQRAAERLKQNGPPPGTELPR